MNFLSGWVGFLADVEWKEFKEEKEAKENENEKN